MDRKILEYGMLNVEGTMTGRISMTTQTQKTEFPKEIKDALKTHNEQFHKIMHLLPYARIAEEVVAHADESSMAGYSYYRTNYYYGCSLQITVNVKDAKIIPEIMRILGSHGLRQVKDMNKDDDCGCYSYYFGYDKYDDSVSSYNRKYKIRLECQFPTADDVAGDVCRQMVVGVKSEPVYEVVCSDQPDYEHRLAMEQSYKKQIEAEKRAKEARDERKA